MHLHLLKIFPNNFLHHYDQFKYDFQGFSWTITKMTFETVLQLCVYHMSYMLITALLSKNNFTFQAKVFKWFDLAVCPVSMFNAMCVGTKTHIHEYFTQNKKKCSGPPDRLF